MKRKAAIVVGIIGVVLVSGLVVLALVGPTGRYCPYMIAPLNRAGNQPDQVSSPDGKMWVSSDGGTLTLRDTATNWELMALKGHGGIVASVAFSPDGTMLASGGADCTTRLWDVATGEQRAVWQEPASVMRVAFSPDGKMLASSSADNTIQLREVASGAERAVWQSQPGWITQLAFSPDGTRLTARSQDGVGQQWDVAEALSGSPFSRMAGIGVLAVVVIIGLSGLVRYGRKVQRQVVTSTLRG